MSARDRAAPLSLREARRERAAAGRAHATPAGHAPHAAQAVTLRSLYWRSAFLLAFAAAAALFAAGGHESAATPQRAYPVDTFASH